VDAIIKAINRLVNVTHVLMNYEVKAVTSGSDALGEVTVRVSSPHGFNNSSATNGDPAQEKPIMWLGHGVDSDILLASAKAYINAINRMLTCNGNVAGSKIHGPI